MHLPKTFLFIGAVTFLGFIGGFYYLVFGMPLAYGLASRLQMLIAR